MINFKIAKRNMIRNKKSNIVIIVILVISIIQIILGLSFIQGILDNYYDLAVGTISGELTSVSNQEFIFYDNNLIQEIESIEGIGDVSPRIITSGFLVNGEETTVCTLVGIDYYKENTLVDNFFDTEEKAFNKNQIALTKQIANKLEANIGDSVEVIITDKNEASKQKYFTISSIYEGKSTNSAIESWCIVDIEVMRLIMDVNENEATNLKIFTDTTQYELTDIKSQVNEIIYANNITEYDFENWYNTKANDYMKAPQIYYTILLAFEGILFVLITIGISSIMFSTALNRTKDIGILRSLGMSNKNVYIIYTLETLMIGIIAIVIGVLAASIFVIILNSLGIISSNDALVFTFGGRVLRLSLTIKNCIIPAVSVLVLSIILSFASMKKVLNIDLLRALNY